jgi:hypothetical protein
VIYNHPSGDPTPSPDDVAVTRAIVQAGKLLDVEVLDRARHRPGTLGILEGARIRICVSAFERSNV